ncbi:cytochrome P450 [Spirillospora sp. CA-255316]
MTTETPSTTSGPGCPHGHVPLYGNDFAADPRQVYDENRPRGTALPVELAPGVEATLILGYDAALEVLRDPGSFPKDGRAWEKTVSDDCPVKPVMAFRPSCLYADGERHSRLRSALQDPLARIDVIDLRRYVEETADALIESLAVRGEADLVGEYARVLVARVFTRLFGCPPELAERLIAALSRIIDVDHAAEANKMLTEALADLVLLKRREPGPDVASWMMAHPARLNDQEMMDQIALFFGFGTEPQHSLIANGLRLLLTDDRFAGDLSGGNLAIEDALDEILWTDPPLANLGFSFPVRDTDFAGTRLPADRPVLVSFAAANTDPSRASGNRVGNRAHLAWGAGPHTCPAKRPARLIATVAIERLLDRFPDMEVAVDPSELRWRPGPFHRSLTALPVRF